MRTILLGAVVLAGLMATPVLGIDYSIEMVDLSVQGSNPFAGGFSIAENGSWPGTIPVTGGSIVGGDMTGNLVFSIAANNLPIGRMAVLMADGHPHHSPLFDSNQGYQIYDPAQNPIPTVVGDPVPPVTTQFGADGFDTFPGIGIGLIIVNMDSVVSRTPLGGGGEQIVYNVSGSATVDLRASGAPFPTTDGFSGTMTLNSVPEPAAALILLAGLPLLRRRR